MQGWLQQLYYFLVFAHLDECLQLLLERGDRCFERLLKHSLSDGFESVSDLIFAYLCPVLFPAFHEGVFLLFNIWLEHNIIEESEWLKQLRSLPIHYVNYHNYWCQSFSRCPGCSGCSSSTSAPGRISPTICCWINNCSASSMSSSRPAISGSLSGCPSCLFATCYPQFFSDLSCTSSKCL